QGIRRRARGARPRALLWYAHVNGACRCGCHPARRCAARRCPDHLARHGRLAPGPQRRPGLCAVGPVRTVGRVRRGEREPRLRLAYRRERGRRRRRLARGGPRHRPAFATFKEGAELMQTLRAAIALALVLFLGVWGAAAQADGPTVLASTAWTGAIAEAAGAAKVDILASFELRHPPERDFRPGDITRALAADVLLWAGYEG